MNNLQELLNIQSNMNNTTNSLTPETIQELYKNKSPNFKPEVIHYLQNHLKTWIKDFDRTERHYYASMIYKLTPEYDQKTNIKILNICDTRDFESRSYINSWSQTIRGFNNKHPRYALFTTGEFNHWLVLEPASTFPYLPEQNQEQILKYCNADHNLEQFTLQDLYRVFVLVRDLDSAAQKLKNKLLKVCNLT